MPADYAVDTSHGRYCVDRPYVHLFRSQVVVQQAFASNQSISTDRRLSCPAAKFFDNLDLTPTAYVEHKPGPVALALLRGRPRTDAILTLVLGTITLGT